MLFEDAEDAPGHCTVPRDLETMLMKCLVRDPDRRYQSAAALKEDLQRFLDGVPVLARRAGPLLKAARFARRRRAGTIAVTAAMLLLVVAGVWGVRQSRQYAYYERTLAGLEEKGALSEKPDQNDLALRDAFLRKKLRKDQSERLVRLLLRPEIRASNYVAQ
jgi:ferric-dicitrate binding protein FerR (iron transport regulator)